MDNLTNETIENAEVVFVAYEQPTVKDQAVAALVGIGVTATVYVAFIGAAALVNVVASRIHNRIELKKLAKETKENLATAK